MEELLAGCMCNDRTRYYKYVFNSYNGVNPYIQETLLNNKFYNYLINKNT